MPELPAICRTCGALFGTGIVLENVRDATFVGNTAGPCPNCGGTGEIPDGVYDVVGGVVSVAATTARSREQLERLAAVLRGARDSGATPDELLDAVEKESPDVAAELRRLLIPRNAAEFWALVAAILAALTLLQETWRASAPLPADPEQIGQIVERAVDQAIGEARATPARGKQHGEKKRNR